MSIFGICMLFCALFNIEIEFSVILTIIFILFVFSFICLECAHDEYETSKKEVEHIAYDKFVKYMNFKEDYVQITFTNDLQAQQFKYEDIDTLELYLNPSAMRAQYVAMLDVNPYIKITVGSNSFKIKAGSTVFPEHILEIIGYAQNVKSFAYQYIDKNCPYVETMEDYISNFVKNNCKVNFQNSLKNSLKMYFGAK